MKTIRYIMLTVMLAGITMTFSSCGEGAEPEGTYIEVSALPQIIVDYVVNNYPGAVIEDAEVYPNGDYELALDNGLELIFDAAGTFIEESAD